MCAIAKNVRFFEAWNDEFFFWSFQILSRYQETVNSCRVLIHSHIKLKRHVLNNDPVEKIKGDIKRCVALWIKTMLESLIDTSREWR
jgi:hypothetical protein